MINYSIILFFIIIGVNCSCNVGPHSDPQGKATAFDNENYHERCIQALRNQIKMEFEASLQYLIMGAHFDRDDINLKGFADFFWSNADEERKHGLDFINYLRHRGDDQTEFLKGDILPILRKTEWTDGLESLRDALLMEKKVSVSIKRMIDVCNMNNEEDYLTGDWLTGHWLEEQMESQRKLAGMINTLSNFRQDHESLGDWMFSNSLL